MEMTSKQRSLTALDGGVPDRLPVTTHHLQDYFRDKYMDGKINNEIFDYFGMDAIHWTWPYLPDSSQGAYFDSVQEELTDPRFNRRIVSDEWQITSETLPDPEYVTTRYTITIPKGALTTVLQANECTTWVSEHLIKEQKDIDIIGNYVTAPKCDVEQVNREAEAFGERGLVRGAICSFDLRGQPGVWQDAAVLVGIEKLIYATCNPHITIKLPGICKNC